MLIKNKLGDALEIRGKYTVINNLNFIITRRYPNGEKSSNFYGAYEAITGHWIASNKKKETLIKDVEKLMPIIKKRLKIISDNESSIGGLFE